MARISDRLVLTEKVIRNCHDCESPTFPNNAVLVTCSKGTVLLAESKYNPRVGRTVWAIRTVENDLYMRVKADYGKYLEKAGIERMHYDSDRTDVVFAYAPVSSIISIPYWEDGITAWCMEACRSGVEAFNALKALNPHQPVEFKGAKALLAERDFRLKRLFSSLGLDKVIEWNGCPKSWHSMRHERKKMGHKIELAW